MYLKNPQELIEQMMLAADETDVTPGPSADHQRDRRQNKTRKPDVSPSTGMNTLVAEQNALLRRMVRPRSAIASLRHTPYDSAP